ncbi:MAG TPA: BON domain-containing protein, partial [Burkholderiaceae bacterium]|nr:BON domain-containing protein [Burkholderiaceae bacterium]
DRGSERHAGGYYGSGAFGRDDRERDFHGRYGESGRDYGRYGDDYGQQGYGRYGRDEERGLWDRTRDEVASWFGDDEAEQRRRMDEMRSGRHRGRGPRGYSRSDERIREDVNDRLTDDPFVDASGIDVKVADSEVTLEGSVEHRSDKRRAEDIAEQVSGVRHVQNNLRVKPSGATTGTAGTAGMGSTSGSLVGSSDTGASTGSGSSASSAGSSAGGASGSSTNRGSTGSSTGSAGGSSGSSTGSTGSSTGR